MFGLLNTTQIYGINPASTHSEHEHQQQQQNQQQQHNFQTHAHIAGSTTISSTSPIPNTIIAPQNHTSKGHRRTSSSISDTSGSSSSKFLSNLTSKSPTNFLEKFLKNDFLNTYDTLKNYRNFSASGAQNKRHSDPLQGQQSQQGFANTFNCLQGSYRHSFDGEFYEKTNVKKASKDLQELKGIVTPTSSTTNRDLHKSSEMTIKCSKNLLAVEPEVQGPATLQNYQKIPESEHDLLVDSLLVASSGASSGEFNSSSDTTTTTQSSSAGGNTSSFSTSSSNIYKRLSFGAIRNSQSSQKQEKNGENSQVQQQLEGITDHSVTLNLTTSLIPSFKVIDLHRSSSSNSSSGDCLSKRERKKGAMTPQPPKTPLSQLLNLSSNSPKSPQKSKSATEPSTPTTSTLTPNSSTSGTPASAQDKAQRRKLLQMLTAYEQQNKLLQRELAKEKRRRSEELACVVKSLLCFESKLKNDMKSFNQRLQDKDVEICRLVRQNRALRKKMCRLQEEASACTRDEGVVEDDEAENEADAKDLLEDCLVLEALQCINCRRQFYDIEVQENCTQTTLTMAGAGGNVSGGILKDVGGNRNIDDPTTEHGSSSDDTVSSSFFGARRSVRYTSKRTSGTFRDYMRSRAMNIDDPSLEADNNSEEYPSTLSHDDSRENIYSRTIERMHGVKCESERDSEEHSGLDTSSSSVTRSNSRASTKSSKSSSSKSSDLSNALEEDDGIFSPTQDEDFEEEDVVMGKLKIVRGRALEAFSEASPKQIYETSTDDWYASASDQEETITPGAANASKCYGQGAVNPVLECVNQILLQQSMEGMEDRSQTPKNSLTTSTTTTTTTTTLPRRSSLSDRRNNQRNNSRASDGAAPNSGNGTLTRKRVHFSTKNSMVHVPRNDETEDEDEQEAHEAMANVISNYQMSSVSSSYISHSPALMDKEEEVETERLEIFNYESIYSNEYEPIGSEMNSSNLYVDMESTTAMTPNGQNGCDKSTVSEAVKASKLPPALPPKPANLLKFKKSLQQLDEETHDELIESHEGEVLVEPDYCSISEVNVGITSVQIRADIHRAPLSERDLESVVENDNDLDAATVVSEANSQKTEEIEEIFADIPKLPNVAAIIAPKSALKQNEYLVMTPKQEAVSKKQPVGIMALASPGAKQKPDRSALKLNLSSLNGCQNGYMASPKMENSPVLRQLTASGSPNNYQQPQYKRKHMPNILQEINKRLSLPNSPVTPPTPNSVNNNKSGSKSSASASASLEANESLNSLPLQAEFDWYNLDVEYGKNSTPGDHGPKVSDMLGNGVMTNSLLADIKEDGESLINTADEYNLDEEYSDDERDDLEDGDRAHKERSNQQPNEAINCILVANNHAKAKKIKKNLANFEKFIENTTMVNGGKSSLNASKRKIYFAGPFV
ncbi:uncharacterized protein LOC106088848 [Stomoxys calcitrans]|uniref:uncharacterized protein LOC106088848 n=1 Tax=Stomoxys calcitrans TaxID=35570 RepID=UPI0027E222E5|nr:uncharacterized protein LOC106088848 [Stomoxys calcitrans]